jgi:hypothetical protein
MGMLTSAVRLATTVGLVATGVVVAAPTAQAVTCPSGANLTWFNGHFDTGTTIPYTNTDYVSQGLGYAPSRDWLITSLSDDTWFPGPNILAVKVRATGTFVKKVVLKDTSGNALGGLFHEQNDVFLARNVGGVNIVHAWTDFVRVLEVVKSVQKLHIRA